jgi:hypothetical protein
VSINDFNDKFDKLKKGKVVPLSRQSKRKPSVNPVADDEDADLIDLNEQYAVVRIGGKTRVTFFEESSIFPGCKTPVYSTWADFTAFLANRKKELPRSDGGSSAVAISRWWLSHPGRRQYDGVIYAPNKNYPTRLNLWSGFSCEPRAGNYELFQRHLRDNLCSGNADHLQYLIKWMARAVQQPGSAGEVAVVMRGKEGTGKGVFAREFGVLFGSHFRHVVHAKHLVGHFNQHLQHCSMLYADEAFFAGDRGHESTLKALITEETLMIEPKGLDPFPVRNCLHVLMSSNADWVVPAGADARRYFVLDVSDQQMQNTGYFAAIVAQMESGGREALLHDLLREDLSTFNVRKVPQTAALAEQKSYSRRGIDLLIEVIASQAALPDPHSIYPNVVITSGEDKGRGFYCSARRLVPDLKHRSSIIIAKELAKWGCKPWKDSRLRGIEFPPLQEVRQRFDQRHGAQTWPTVDEWVAAATTEAGSNADE